MKLSIEQILIRDEMVEAAKDYISKRLSIIPVGKNKVPLIPWKEFCNRIAKPEEVDAWFEKFPDAQLGMVTGEISGLTVVDVEFEGGAKEWNKLPQSCPIVKTGGGGRHYWYLYEASMKNAVRIDGQMKNTDIRNNGGYVVLPPSKSDKGSYEWIQKIPPVHFPKNLFRVKGEGTGGYVEMQDKSIGMNFLSNLYDGNGMGSRNDSMVKYIGYLFTQIHPEDWESKAWPLTLEANSKNTPPLSEHELRASYDSIRQTEKSNSPDRFSTGKPESWETEDENDEVMQLGRVAEAQTIDFSKPFPSGIKIFDDEIRGGFFPGDLIIIGASSGHGKTSFAQYLSFNFLKKNKEKVLFFSYEVLSQFVWEKFSSMGLTKDDFIFMPFKHTTGNIGWVEKKIREAKEKFGIKLVVIDHMGFLEQRKSTGGGGENYSIQLTKIARELKSMAIKEEVAIVVPVHVRKRPGGEKKSVNNLDIEDIAHSSGIYQEADLVFLLKREETLDEDANDLFTDYSLISLAKNRRGSKNPRGFFTLLNELFIHDSDYSGILKEMRGEGKRSKNTSYGNSEEKMAEELERSHKEQVAQSEMFGEKE